MVQYRWGRVIFPRNFCSCGLPCCSSKYWTTVPEEANGKVRKYIFRILHLSNLKYSVRSVQLHQKKKKRCECTGWIFPIYRTKYIHFTNDLCTIKLSTVLYLPWKYYVFLRIYHLLRMGLHSSLNFLFISSPLGIPLGALFRDSLRYVPFNELSYWLSLPCHFNITLICIAHI